MDVGPICHAYKFMTFLKRLNRENFYFSNFVASWRYESYGKIQNFSSISLTLCLLGQKDIGTWIVNTTITNTMPARHVVDSSPANSAKEANINYGSY